MLEEVKKGDKLTVLEDVSDWKKVCTKSGVVGYIQKSKLKDAKKETISREFEEPDYTGIRSQVKLPTKGLKMRLQLQKDSIRFPLHGSV